MERITPVNLQTAQGRAKELLDAVKAKAKAKGIPITRYVRMLIEQDVGRT